MTITDITGQITIGNKSFPVHNVSIDWMRDHVPSTLSAFNVSRFLGVSFTEVVTKVSIESIDLLAEYINQLDRQAQPAKFIIPKHQPLDGWRIRRPKKQSHRRMTVYAKRYIRLYYDIVPERTHEDFQRGYRARMDQVKDQLQNFVDIDMPLVDDEGDW